MNDFLIYVLKVSIVFSVLTVVYNFFWSRLTFHGINRLLLISFIPLSLILPFLDMDLGFLEGSKMQDLYWDEPMVSGEIRTLDKDLPIGENDWGITGYSSWVYLCGVGVYIGLLACHAFKLFQIKREAQYITGLYYTILKSKYPVVFSCFNWVFVPEGFSSSKGKTILKHEEGHVKLGHTYDLILTEFFVAFAWFNPLVFLFRRLIKSIHEFQADEYVLSNKISKSDYLTVMLDDILVQKSISFSSSFKSLTIKKRIEMITKNKSEKKGMVKYMLSLPLVVTLCIVLSAFSDTGSIPSIGPIKEGGYKKITSEYGMRENPFTKEKQMHFGVDFSAETGTEIMATGDGKVVKARFEKNWGNLIVLQHSGGFQTYYAHLKGFAIEEGKQVKMGSVIGYVGSTGKSTAPHLHYGVRLDGNYVNPAPYLNIE